MKKSRTLQLLRSLSKKELRRFKKWLASPAHNQRRDVRDLLDFLLEKDRLHRDEELDKAMAFAKLFPEREHYDDAYMRQVLHFFHKALEGFVIYEQQNRNACERQLVLAEAFRQRKLSKLLEQQFRALQKLLDKTPERSADYFRHLFRLESLKYDFYSSQKRTGPLNLQEMSQNLELQFIIEKLRLSGLMLSHANVFKVSYDFGLLEELLRYVEQKNLQKIPAVSIYYHSLLVLQNRENEGAFAKLKEALFQYGELLPQEELRENYLFAINYCIGRINAGIARYWEETFDFYRKGLENGILLQDGLLSRWTFRNIVTAATRLKQFDWTEAFIRDHQQYLHPSHRESIVHYCRAKLLYERKEYRPAMQLLAIVEYDDILMTLAAKTMLLKMYYELDEYDALESLLDSMKRYMSRKKVIGYHKANYNNVIRYTRKLVNLNPFDREEIARLQQEVESVSPLTERQWILEMLARL